MAKNKHLVNEERSQIEHLLRNGKSIKEIARILNKSASTISREIKKRSVPSDKSAMYRVRNRCVHRGSCKKIQLCEDKPDCTRRCSACKHCNSVCPDFVEEICLRLSFPPYVCNGCVDERVCTLRKQYCLHRIAQKSYEELLVGSRAGANISEEEPLRLDEFLSPLIRKGPVLEEAFRLEVFKMLKKEEKITDSIIENMMTWHHSGFNVYCGERIWPSNSEGLERLAQYIIRAPISQERMIYIPAV